MTMTGGGSMMCATDLRIVLADTAEERRKPWPLIQAEGLDKVLVAHRLHPHVVDWLDIVNPAHALLLTGYDMRTGEMCACSYVSPMMGKSGNVHCCIFRQWRRDADMLGRCALDYFFSHWDFASLLGVTPRPFRHVRRLAHGWGFADGATVPGMLHMPRPNDLNHCEDAVISVLTRDAFQ